MLLFLMAELSIKGFKYHGKRSDKIPREDKKYAYHVYMMKIYHDILELTISSNRLKERYLK